MLTVDLTVEVVEQPLQLDLGEHPPAGRDGVLGGVPGRFQSKEVWAGTDPKVRSQNGPRP